MAQKIDMKALAEQWPKRLEYTGLEKILMALSIVIVFGTVAHLAFIYGNLPAQMPSHFDFAGNVDDYDSKFSLVFLAGANVLCCVSMLVCGHFPRMFNIPMGLLKRPLEVVLHSTRVFLYITTIMMALLFLYIQEGAVLVAAGVWMTLPSIGTWAFMIVLFASIGIYFYWLWRG